MQTQKKGNNPNNKKGNKKKQKSIFWNLVVLGIFIFVILNLVFIKKSFEYANVIAIDQITLQKLTDSNFNVSTRIWTKLANNQSIKCPDARGGNPDSYLTIKYFYSKFCPWCIKEEPILKRLVEKYGNFVNVEWYNVKNCPELVNKYKVSGVPNFVMSTPDNQTEYKHYGFIPEKDLVKFVCDVTGECYKAKTQAQIVNDQIKSETVIKNGEVISEREVLSANKEINTDLLKN